jgi:hypothetical protein
MGRCSTHEVDVVRALGLTLAVERPGFHPAVRVGIGSLLCGGA